MAHDEDCTLCGGEVDEEMLEADRMAIQSMTAALERHPDLAKKLWVVLKLAAGEVN